MHYQEKGHSGSLVEGIFTQSLGIWGRSKTENGGNSVKTLATAHNLAVAQQLSAFMLLCNFMGVTEEQVN